MRTLRRVGLHLAVSIAVTFPLVLHLTSALPLGIEDTATVPLFNLWTLRWNQLQLGDLYRSYWDAPIFHPTPGAFAFSDPQPLTGLVFAPISWLTHNPALAYNLVVLAIFTLNGLAAARLARRLGAPEWPAVLTGVLAQGLPFAMNQIGVLQLTVLFPLFFLIDAVIVWATTDDRGAGPAVGVWLSVTFLTSSYYGLFAMVVVPLAALTLVSRAWFTPRRLLGLGAGAVIFAVTALPIALVQKQYTDPYPRSEQTIDQLSAQAIDYAHLQPDKVGISVLPFLRSGGGSFHALYPGTVLLLLAGIGAVLALRSRPAAVDLPPVVADPASETEPARELQPKREVQPEREPSPTSTGATEDERPAVAPRIGLRRLAIFLVVGALLSFALSFGLHLGIGSFNIYDVLRLHVPGLASLRSPFRFAALVQVFLIPLAGVTVARMWRRPEDGGRVIAAGLIVFALLEVALPPLALTDVPDAAAEWVTYIGSQPGADAVAVVPFPRSGDVTEYEPTTEWMLSALGQAHPLVNGYSGLFPPAYDELEVLMQGFPRADSLDAMRARGVRWVVVHDDWLTPTRAAEIEATSRLHAVFRGGASTVFTVS